LKESKLQEGKLGDDEDLVDKWDALSEAACKLKRYESREADELKDFISSQHSSGNSYEELMERLRKTIPNAWYKWGHLAQDELEELRNS